MTDSATNRTYPPSRHVLRDLCMETEKRAVDHTVTWAPAQPNVCTDAGTVRLGVIGALIDASGAMVALAAAQPDWIATADLSYLAGASVRDGPVVCSSRLVRAGTSVVVVAVEVFDGQGREEPADGLPAGRGLMTFSRIPASATRVALDPRAGLGVRSRHALADSGFARPLPEQLGMRVVDPGAGVLEMDHSDYVTNSFGTINGGAICMLVEAAAEHAARAAGAAGHVASDLSVHYLAQIRNGPVRSHVDVLRGDDAHTVCALTLVDSGNEDRLLAMASVTLSRTRPGDAVPPPR